MPLSAEDGTSNDLPLQPRHASGLGQSTVQTSGIPSAIQASLKIGDTFIQFRQCQTCQFMIFALLFIQELLNSPDRQMSAETRNHLLDRFPIPSTWHPQQNSAVKKSVRQQSRKPLSVRSASVGLTRPRNSVWY